MDQCSILYVAPLSNFEEARAVGLRSLGFKVETSEDMPASETVARYHAVIVRAGDERDLPMLAARLRAKRHFGRRVLVALVPDGMPARHRRDVVLSGFDHTLPDTCGARDLAATVLRLLRPYPEYRCLLRLPGGRRKAA